MGSYNSKIFSKEFSKRTEANLEFISKTVNRDKTIVNCQNEFFKQYEKIINEISALEDKLNAEANDIPNARRKGKDELKRKIHSIISKIDEAKKDLKHSFNELPSEKKYKTLNYMKLHSY